MPPAALQDVGQLIRKNESDPKRERSLYLDDPAKFRELFERQLKLEHGARRKAWEEYQLQLRSSMKRSSASSQSGPIRGLFRHWLPAITEAIKQEQQAVRPGFFGSRFALL